MGWTSMQGANTRELIESEMNGCDVLASSGNWRLFRNPHGHVGLVHFLTERHDGCTYIKPVEIEMGPIHDPPPSLARKLVELYNGDIDKAGGSYGAANLRRALQPQPKAPRVGDTLTFNAGAETWSDGVAVTGTYIYLGKYRARRTTDQRVVGLPRTWRRIYRVEVITEAAASSTEVA